MPLVVTSVPNLAQGVSQQPDNLRYPGQCDEQINAWATVVEGLVKRPNTRWINEFNSGSTPTNLFTHFVKRDEQNKYCVTVSLGGSVPTVGVIDLASGTNISVATTSIANSYLSGITNPLADLRALTVADYTFLVNKKKEVKVDDSDELKSKDLEFEALVVVKLGDYEKNYDIYLENQLVRPASLNTNNPAYPSGVQSDQIPKAGHTYESGNSQGQLRGEYADTGVIAEDLGIILEDYLSGQDGLGSVELGTSQSGSGFEDSGKKQRVVTSIATALKPIKNVSYEFFLDQYSDASHTTKIATGTKGTAVFSGGSLSSYNLTHKGINYDNTLALNTYKLIIRKHTSSTFAAMFGPDTTITSYINIDNSTPGYVLPSIDSITTQSLNYQIFQNGSVIKIKADADFTIRTEDGLSNEALKVAYKEVDSIVDLPKHCYNQFRIKVRGDADVDQDDYYVVFKTKDNEDFGEGAWVETVGWRKGIESSRECKGINTSLEVSTMPITLVVDSYDSSGAVNSFTLQAPNEYANIVKHNGNFYNLVETHVSNSDNEPGTGADWEVYWVQTTVVNSAKDWKINNQYFERDTGYVPRQSGDDNTNPFPSFVGNTINDVFFFKNRLGFLTDSNVIFSEADEYFNFFRTTTQQLLDSAPIDVGLSHTKVAVLQHALPFQEKLMLFSDNSQFVLRGADVLSPKTVAISPVTEYDISDGIAPLALGPYIYFPFNRGQYEGMFEYFVDNNTEVFEAEEITSQIPKYIPSKIKRMAGSASESMVLLQNDTDAKTLYVYKYFWSGKEKIQSAWQKWTFDDDVTGFDFIDSTLYLILNGKVLVEMPVENALTDVGFDYTLLLDNRVDGDRDYDNDNFPDLLVNYDEETNRTTISNLPDGYGATVDNTTVFTKGGSERNVVSSASGTSVEIEGFIASYVDNGGAYVQYDGEYYYCIKTHTSVSTFESQYWRKAVYPLEDTPAWSPSVTYSQGTIYRCQINHTSPSTFATGIHWQSTTEVPSAPEWGPNIFYNNKYYFVVGKPYDMLYRFSNQALKQPTERGGRSASDYTYQTIRNASIEYADTGHFTVEVTSRFRNTYSYVYNPAVLSSISTLDRFTPESGHFRFGVQCRPEEATIEVKSSSALPVKLLAAEFESMVTGRSKRYGA